MLFAGKITSISKAAAVIAAAGLLSRILGVVRDRLLATRFGAGDALDVYYAAFRLPEFLFYLTSFGALSAVFLPVFVSLFKSEKPKENADAWDLMNNVINTLSLGLIVFGVLGFIFAPWIVALIVPGFSGEKLTTTIELTRWLLITPLLFGLSAVFGGALQALKKFWVFAFAPVLYNAGIICGAIFFAPFLGIKGVVFGVLAGASAHLLAQAIAVFRQGYCFRVRLNWQDKSLRKMFKLAWPRLFGLASGQLNFVVIAFYASSLSSGALAIFNFADNLQCLPLGLFALSFSIAAFTDLARNFSASDEKSFGEIFTKTSRKILFFVIPSSILMIVLRVPLVRLVLGAGKFDSVSINITAVVFAILCSTLIAQALIYLLARAFYARQNTMAPFIAAFCGLLATAISGFWLSRAFGVSGLAGSYSFGAIVNFIIIFVWLKLVMRKNWQAGLFAFILKNLFAALAMAAFVLYVSRWLEISTAAGLIDLVVRLGLAGLAGAAIFMVVCWLLKVEEAKAMWRRFLC